MAHPDEGIAGFCAAQGIEIMHHAINLFRDTQGAKLWEIENKLSRRLSIWCQLKFEGHAIDLANLTRLLDYIGWRQKRHLPRRQSFSKPAIHMPGRRFGQKHAKHRPDPTQHRIAGNNVFAHSFFKESVGCDDLHLTLSDIVFIDERSHTPKMVAMAMRV